ncbi:MAG: hypothetical protein V7K71_09050 [Nostoc sp.]|uniref:hypothetical protein n=1 Tax=Nostoc sp. TaxID=1180 RepID=UPI002FF9E9AF
MHTWCKFINLTSGITKGICYASYSSNSELTQQRSAIEADAAGKEADLERLGAFDPMPFQMIAVKRSLEQLRPNLLLADSVGLGKTIQVGMILTGKRDFHHIVV